MNTLQTRQLVAPLTARTPRRRELPSLLAGAVVLVVVWAALAQNQPELTLPSPSQTWHAFTQLVSDDQIVSELARTIGRAAFGLCIAFGIGLIWGGLAGRFRQFGAFMQSSLSMLMALPPVVLVALGIVWLGPGGSVTHMVVTLVALPLIVVSVTEAVRAVDADLLEMARSFELSRWKTFRHVVAPGIASPVLAATSVTAGQGLRVAVMAELLSATDGVGAQVALAQTNLNTADLFAWAIVLVIIVIVIETLILRPLTARLLAWRNAGAVAERLIR